MKILVTGAAGFIGNEVSKMLLEQEEEVIGLDNMNDYYEVSLKEARLKRLKNYTNFIFYKLNLMDSEELIDIFKKHKPARVIHLAAQAGVRYSLENPFAYQESNLQGFLSILEACRQHDIEHLTFASSSSVYGANTKYPFSEFDRTDHPVSLYAATKKANEMLAHSYSHLYSLPVTGLRFFTVYGPWGRPDMAPMQFAKAISQGKTIQVNNYGDHQRDFTFIEDITTGTIQAMRHIAKPNLNWSGENPETSSSTAPYRIYNIGFGRPSQLMHFIGLLEESLKKKAVIEFRPKQPGDVDITYADTTSLEKNVGYKPKISLEEGIPKFIEWFKQYSR